MSERRAEHSGRRRRHLGRPRRHRATGRHASSTSTASPSCPTRRRPAWWSSTRRAWPTPSWRSPAPRSRTAARWPGSGSPTSGRRASSGSAPPGGRWRPASAGRTCAPSGPAWSCRPRASGWRRTRRPPRSWPSSTRSIPNGREPSKGELCFGTVDSWVAWTLSGGAAAGRDALHVTDATNAAVTALVDSAIGWDEPLLQTLRIPSADAAGDRRLVRNRRAPRPPCPGRRPSAASPGTSRPPSSARAARCPVSPRPPSAPAACSTSVSVPAALPAP